MNVKWIVLEVSAYTIWIGLFIALCFLTVSSSMTNELTALHDSFWQLDKGSFNSSNDVYDWLRSDLVPRTMKDLTDLSDMVTVSVNGPSTLFAANNFSMAQLPHVVAGTDMVLIGTIRLRQLRVTQGSCDTSNHQYAHISQFCQEDYSFGSTDDSQDYSSSSTPWYIAPGYEFQTSLPTVDLVSPITSINYPPNGYVIDLPTLPSQAIQAINDLEQFDWIDYRTSAVIAEVNTYHAERNAFVNDQFLFEFTSLGLKVFASQTTHIIPGRFVSFDISTSEGIVQFVFDLLNLVMFALLAVYFSYLFVRVFGRLFSFVYSYIDITILVCFSLLIAWRSKLYSVMQSDVISPMVNQGIEFPNPQVFWPLSRLNDYFDWTISIQTILLLLLLARGTKLFFLWSGIVGMLRETFVDNFGHIVTLCVFMSVVGLGFSWSNYEVLGYNDFRFSTIESSIINTSKGYLGLIPVLSIWIEKAGLEAFSFMCFVLLVYIVLIPILIAVAVSGALTRWDKVREDVRGNPMTVFFKSLVGSGTAPETEVDFEKGIDIRGLPTSVRRRIFERRRAVRRRVEQSTGYMNPAFDEFNDFVSRYELTLILQIDPYVGKILRTKNADEVIERFGSEEAKEKPGNTIMIPEVAEISENLSSSIDETKSRLHQELERISKSVGVIYESAKRINERVKSTKAD